MGTECERGLLTPAAMFAKSMAMQSWVMGQSAKRLR